MRARPAIDLLGAGHRELLDTLKNCRGRILAEQRLRDDVGPADGEHRAEIGIVDEFRKARWSRRRLVTVGVLLLLVDDESLTVADHRTAPRLVAGEDHGQSIRTFHAHHMRHRSGELLGGLVRDGRGAHLSQRKALPGAEELRHPVDHLARLRRDRHRTRLDRHLGFRFGPGGDGRSTAGCHEEAGCESNEDPHPHTPFQPISSSSRHFHDTSSARRDSMMEIALPACGSTVLQALRFQNTPDRPVLQPKGSG